MSTGNDRPENEDDPDTGGRTSDELYSELESAQERLQEEREKAGDELREGLDELGLELDADDLIGKIMDERGSDEDE